MSTMRVSAALAFCLSACFAGPPKNGPECDDSQDIHCEQNFACVDFKCTQMCSSGLECAANEACISSVCTPYSQNCQVTGDCVSGFYCFGGACVKKQGLGAPCGTQTEACASGACVDNVCCNSLCAGSCQTCITGTLVGDGDDGTCGSVPAGEDPDNECGAAACDGNGACFGKTQGTPCGANFECSTGQCSDGVCCNGACAGACETCATGTCEAIPDSMDPDGECAGGSACSGGRACYPGSHGTSCDHDYECVSGFCTDRVCCNAACDGVCRVCDAAGACQAVASASDPDTCSSTVAGGSCAAPCMCDVGAVCSTSPAGACSADGQCASGRCLGGVCCDAACPGACRSCNSDHTGQAQGSCAPILAGRDPFNECAAHLVCDGTGACYNKAIGQPCAYAYECASAVCIDGVCCGSACSAVCQSCNAAYTASPSGVCDDIDNGIDPDRECAGGASCDGNGACWAKANGAACSANHECLSGLCAGSICIARVMQLALGGNFTCALLDDGRVKCWGGNSQGQLGLGDTLPRGDNPGEMGANLPAVSFGTGRRAISLAAGDSHACAILDNGALKCWGENTWGQLGVGDGSDRGDQAGEMGDSLPPVSLGTGRIVRNVSAGDMHTCAILDNQQLKCWGENFVGQLGLGNTVPRGKNSTNMGDSLPAVALGTGRTAASVAAGGLHTCAILDNGQTKCWGSNAYGKLGLGDTAHRGDNAGEMGDALPTVNFGTGRVASLLAGGTVHTCAVLNNAGVKCWGFNSTGGLGLGDTSHRGDGPGEMGDNLPLVGLGSGRTALGVAVGEFHSCARLDASEMKCWGNGTYGALGLGDVNVRGDQAGEMGDSLPVVSLGTGRSAVAIAAGSPHTCALLDNGRAKCWGRNSSGELGLGDTNDRGDDANEMGDFLPYVDL